MWRFRRPFTRLDFIDDFALLAKLIRDHLGSIPEADAIRKILKDAIPVYEARNLLAHGHWYSFDPATSTIEARAWDGGAKPRNFTEAEIWFLRDQFKEFLAELHKLRFEIEKLPRKSREERATKTIPKALHATIVGIGSMLALIILMIQAIWRP